jgi:hypothetical protein
MVFVGSVIARDEDGMADRGDIAAALGKATGADADIDRMIAECFAVASVDYSASIDHCRALAGQLLPGWRLHLGYGVTGLFPYASLTRGDEIHIAEAPTLPLAVLRALFAVPVLGVPAN